MLLLLLLHLHVTLCTWPIDGLTVHLLYSELGVEKGVVNYHGRWWWWGRVRLSCRLRWWRWRLTGSTSGRLCQADRLKRPTAHGHVFAELGQASQAGRSDV